MGLDSNRARRKLARRRTFFRPNVPSTGRMIYHVILLIPLPSILTENPEFCNYFWGMRAVCRDARRSSVSINGYTYRRAVPARLGGLECRRI
jgi:hypothetical protein